MNQTDRPCYHLKICRKCDNIVDATCVTLIHESGEICRSVLRKESFVRSLPASSFFFFLNKAFVSHSSSLEQKKVLIYLLESEINLLAELTPDRFPVM